MRGLSSQKEITATADASINHKAVVDLQSFCFLIIQISVIARPIFRSKLILCTCKECIGQSKTRKINTADK